MTEVPARATVRDERWEFRVRIDDGSGSVVVHVADHLVSAWVGGSAAIIRRTMTPAAAHQSLSSHVASLHGMFQLSLLAEACAALLPQARTLHRTHCTPPTSSHIASFLHLLMFRLLQPRAVILENVRPLATADVRAAFHRVASILAT